MKLFLNWTTDSTEFIEKKLFMGAICDPPQIILKH